MLHDDLFSTGAGNRTLRDQQISTIIDLWDPLLGFDEEVYFATLNNKTTGELLGCCHVRRADQQDYEYILSNKMDPYP